MGAWRAATRFFDRLEADVRPDVVLSVTGPAYWRPKAPHVTGYNLPHYIYEDSPFFERMSRVERIKWRAKGRVMRAFFQRDADAYLVQTEDVKQRLARWLSTEKPIHLVSNTCNHHFLTPGSVAPKLDRKQPADGIRLLMISAFHRHKHFELLPEIIRLSRRDGSSHGSGIEFVLTLRQREYEGLIPEDVRSSVRNVGPVPPDEVPSLYKECDALFMPTLLECFSASYAEAMAMDKPIITTDLGFARSICADAALYFDPLSAEDALGRIRQVQRQPDVVKALVEAGRIRLDAFHTPVERARRILTICEEMAGSSQVYGGSD